ncbi:MAG: D-tyrosyl-tRNA(Tyr) deacylase [Kiritimatiellae bacterium]|nr:D-tyrosyl-tRNA(Tyr) deacylase [Kiritimatiellia bacterium]
MRLVIQRSRKARVTVADREAARIERGAVILVGVARGDTDADAAYLARKTSQLRIFNDSEGRLNSSIHEAGGAYLVVSQFTLYADCGKGNRPSYIEAAAPAEAERLYEEYARQLGLLGHEVQTGRFREHMVVELENDGPVTIVMESRGRGKA